MRIAQSFMFGHMAVTVIEVNGLYYTTSQNIYNGETVIIVSGYKEKEICEYLETYYTGFNS